MVYFSYLKGGCVTAILAIRYAFKDTYCCRKKYNDQKQEQDAFTRLLFLENKWHVVVVIHFESLSTTPSIIH